MGNVRDLFLLESIFGKLEVMDDKEPGARTRWEGFGDLEGYILNMENAKIMRRECISSHSLNTRLTNKRFPTGNKATTMFGIEIRAQCTVLFLLNQKNASTASIC